MKYICAMKYILFFLLSCTLYAFEPSSEEDESAESTYFEMVDIYEKIKRSAHFEEDVQDDHHLMESYYEDEWFYQKIATISPYAPREEEDEESQITMPIMLCNSHGHHEVKQFLHLPLLEWEKKNIYKIVSTMGEKNVVQLLFEKKTLERKGKEINHVHPMRFIGYAFSDPYLKKCMARIKTSGFKWGGFIDGFGGRMKEEYNRNNLLPYVPSFCEYLNANPEKVTRFIQNRDWDGLVKYLISS